MEPSKGFTLIETIIAFTIFVISLAFIYQSINLFTSKYIYLIKVSRDIVYIEDYNTSVVGELSGASSLIQVRNVDFGKGEVECEEKTYSTRYYLCPYKDISPLNPNIEVHIPGVYVMVFNSGFRMLVNK
jgi:prepilin-type N-terminal cleavage/methylation domain-containing protein